MKTYKSPFSWAETLTYSYIGLIGLRHMPLTTLLCGKVLSSQHNCNTTEKERFSERLLGLG